MERRAIDTPPTHRLYSVSWIHPILEPSLQTHDSNTWDVRRVGVLVLALFQLGVAVVLPGADAVLDARTASAPVHVESTGNDDCVQHHDHVFCQVVRSLFEAIASGDAGASSTDALPGLQAYVSIDDHELTRPILLRGSVAPRAPPLI